MSPGAAEYTVSKTYLDWILETPWEVSTEDNLDIGLAAKVLNEDHYDLDEVKERILEFLSVKKLEEADSKGSILCLVGPSRAWERPRSEIDREGDGAASSSASRSAGCGTRPR